MKGKKKNKRKQEEAFNLLCLRFSHTFNSREIIRAKKGVIAGTFPNQCEIEGIYVAIFYEPQQIPAIWTIHRKIGT